MEYPMEELLPIVTKLVDKYTSKDSSSVSYEVARMIMGAVIYCIDENSESECLHVPAGAARPPALQMYESGYEIVIRKVQAAKLLYETIIAGFEDYGCRNYRDTILNGMPAFFMRYDARFNPRDHLLTLDYPVMGRYENMCGIDRILEYLRSIRAEQQFLDCFPPAAVAGLLERIVPDYRALYLDNICEAVMLQAIQCAMAGKAIMELRLEAEDIVTIRKLIAGKSLGDIEEMVVRIITLMIRPLPVDASYFTGAGRDCAVRLQILTSA